MKSYFVLLSLFIGQLQCQVASVNKAGDCGVTRSCMTMPYKCTPSIAFDFRTLFPCTVISWRTGEDGISVTVYGENTDNPGDWVGVGLSKTGGMETSDTYICKRLGEEIQLVSAYSAARGPPTEYPTELNDPSSNPGIADGTIGTSRDENSYSCTFVINPTVTKEGETFNYVKDVGYTILVARGSLTDWRTTYHTEKLQSLEVVEFHPDEKQLFIRGNAKTSAMIKSHAALMFVAWALCAPLG